MWKKHHTARRRHCDRPFVVRPVCSKRTHSYFDICNNLLNLPSTTFNIKESSYHTYCVDRLFATNYQLPATTRAVDTSSLYDIVINQRISYGQWLIAIALGGSIIFASFWRISLRTTSSRTRQNLVADVQFHKRNFDCTTSKFEYHTTTHPSESKFRNTVSPQHYPTKYGITHTYRYSSTIHHITLIPSRRVRDEGRGTRIQESCMHFSQLFHWDKRFRSNIVHNIIPHGAMRI